MKSRHFHSIFISDTHFGYPINGSRALVDFLKKHTCNNLYLVGDIIDFWVLRKKVKLSKADGEAILKILEHGKKGTRIIYLTGNHDDILRDIQVTIEGVKICDEIIHTGINGKSYLVIHGDLFDTVNPLWNVIYHFGNSAYIFLLRINRFLSIIRGWIGLPDWKFSLFMKQKVKRAVNFIMNYENHMVAYCKKNGYYGIISGHIHTPTIKIVDGIEYMNCGDWVENDTALVEHTDGRWEIIKWRIRK